MEPAPPINSAILLNACMRLCAALDHWQVSALITPALISPHHIMFILLICMELTPINLNWKLHYPIYVREPHTAKCGVWPLPFYSGGWQDLLCWITLLYIAPQHRAQNDCIYTGNNLRMLRQVDYIINRIYVKGKCLVLGNFFVFLALVIRICLESTLFNFSSLIID